MTGDFLIASSQIFKRSTSSLSLPPRLLKNPFRAAFPPGHHYSVDRPLSGIGGIIHSPASVGSFPWSSSKTSFSHTGHLTLGHTRGRGGCVYKVHTVCALAGGLWMGFTDPVWLGCEGCEFSWDWRGQQMIGADPWGLSLQCTFLSSSHCQRQVFSWLTRMKTHGVTLRGERVTGCSVFPSPRTLLKDSIFPREDIRPLWIVWNRCHGEKMANQELG